MAAVPHKTLSWLYNVLTREYRDPNRTYSDLANTLARYPSFSPRTDVYTFENGTSALLARFVGTLPVSFRGAIFGIPLAIWIPHEYPYEAPLVYVTPTDDMRVRLGQHVGGDGRVYHHYLAHWREAWDRSNVIDLMSVLSDIFAKEPPVVSRQQIPSRLPLQPPADAPNAPLYSAVSQEPQYSHSTPSRKSPATWNGPPPPPPKQPTGAQRSTVPQRSESLGRYDAPPPLPPQYPVRQSSPGMFRPSQGNGTLQEPMIRGQYLSQYGSSLGQQVQGPPHGNQDLRAPPNARQRAPDVPPLPAHVTTQQQTTTYAQQIVASNRGPSQQHQQQQQQQQQQQSHRRYHPAIQQPLQQNAKPPPPPIDLLDSPFDVTIPLESNLPVPPVPRNPEKDALLSVISQALTQTLHASIEQNDAALPNLQAQHGAMSSTYQKLEAELSNITALNTTLTSNVSILQSSIRKVDGAVSSAKERAKRGDVPKVDEMLTAPTVVGKQIYDVICEERGIEAGLWALQEGLVRGRVSADVWAKKTRELAREGFKKKVLAQKIGNGMGLEVA